jgi:hypothetical protein
MRTITTKSAINQQQLGTSSTGRYPMMETILRDKYDVNQQGKVQTTRDNIKFIPK